MTSTLDIENIQRSSVFIDGMNILTDDFYKIDYQKLKECLQTNFGAKAFRYFGVMNLGEYFEHHDFTQHGSVIPNNDIQYYEYHRINGVKFLKQLRYKGYQVFIKPYKAPEIDINFFNPGDVSDLMISEILKNVHNYDTFVFMTGSKNFLVILEAILKKHDKNIVLISKKSNTASELLKLVEDNKEKCRWINLEKKNIKKILEYNERDW